MANSNVWSLMIEKDNGKCFNIFASEDILKGEIEEWCRHEQKKIQFENEHDSRGATYRDEEGWLCRKIIGFSNDATRSETILVYRFVDVISMFLEEM